MEALRLFPSTTIAALRQFVPWQRPERSRLFVDYLIIAGGGSGRIITSGGNQGAGGGGAGGYKTSMRGELAGGGFPATPPLTLYKGLTYTVTVGAGGAAGVSGNIANNGTQSRISQSLAFGDNIFGTLGGQGIAANATSTLNGGGGASTIGQSAGGDATGANSDMYRGGSGFTTATVVNIAGGGGGGAGAVGGAASAGVGGNGGAGRASSITGSSVTRAGGGGGSRNAAGGQGTGGTGGGGAAAFGVSATAGTANTGSGGGGAEALFTTFSSGAGGSGIVILRHPAMYPLATTTGSPTITTVSGYRIYEFTGTGSILF